VELRLAAIPGLESVALTTAVPPHDGGERLFEVDRPGHSIPEQPRFVSIVMVSPQYFDVMQMPLHRGRLFEATDGTHGLETVVINGILAEQFFPGEDPIGRRIRFTQRDATPNRYAGRPVDRITSRLDARKEVQHWSEDRRQLIEGPVRYQPSQGTSSSRIATPHDC
jgi:MacB-like periplasmic core domain